MIELYEHNQAAYKAVQEQLSLNGKAAVIHPTGTGKSFIAFKLAEEHPEALFAWISPSEHIYNTQLENIKQASDFKAENIIFLTYAKLMLMDEAEIALLKPDYIILDEFHRAGAAEWGKGVRTLIDACPNALLVGLSATNVRYLDHQRDMAAELFDNCIADQMSLGEAVARGILPAPKYVVSFYSYKLDIQRYKSRMKQVSAPVRRQAEQYLEKLRRALERADGLDEIFARHMDSPHGKYIVFCAGYDHMRQMLEKAPQWFQKVDPEAHYYTVWSDSASAREDYAAFKADSSEHLKLLFCIDMFNEGIHVEDISGVILFRPTISPIIYKQQIGRALSAMKGEQPVIFDVVNNFENLYTISALQEEMRQVITFYRNEKRENLPEAETFRIIDTVKDARELFEQLEGMLKLSWEAMYREAKAYYQLHGDLNMPSSYRTEEGVPLGNWVQTQRSVYNGTAEGLLTEERIARLNEIGMEWQFKKIAAWESGFAHAAAYRQRFGNLDIPSQYIAEDGYKLGAWIARERFYYMRDRNAGRDVARNERYCRLSALGLKWQKSDISFEKGLLEATRFSAENGHLDVPYRYVTPDGYYLGAWIGTMRRRYLEQEREIALTPEQIKRLNDIGMIWEKRNGSRWESNFAEAKAYYQQHGHLKMPRNYTSNGINVWTWLRTQITAYRKGELSADRIRKLEAIGIGWETRAKSWEENYRQAVRYSVTHNDLEIPPDYVAENGTWLGKWLSNQRNEREKGKLTAEQIKKLDQIGMRWQPMQDYRWEKNFEELSKYWIDPLLGFNALPDTAQTPFGNNLKRWAMREEEKFRAGKLNAERQRKWAQLRRPRTA